MSSRLLATTCVVALLAGIATAAVANEREDGEENQHHYARVLLISVDGLHAVDLSR